MQSYLEIAKKALQQRKDQAEGATSVTNYEFNEVNEFNIQVPLGDGQPPPLDRPPDTEMELRRLIDRLADPVAFAAWLEWAMNYNDPAEER